MTGNTPAKKATPKFSDLTGNKDKDKEENTNVVDNKDDNKNNEDDNKNSENQTPSEAAESAIGPDNDKKNVRVDVQNNNDRDEPFIADGVTALRADKTPAEMAAESPDETVERYGIDTNITDEDADNPRVQVYRDTKVNQVPSGTHLHPDIAKDLMNRGISEQHTDNAQVTRQVTEYYDFAPDADHNDKF